MDEHTHDQYSEEDLPRIFLRDEEGNSHEFFIVDRVTIDGFEHDYLLLYPVVTADDDTDGYLVTRVRDATPEEAGDEDGGVYIEFIESEEELDAVASVLEEAADPNGRYALVNLDDTQDLPPHEPHG